MLKAFSYIGQDNYLLALMRRFLYALNIIEKSKTEAEFQACPTAAITKAGIRAS
jgi:hypothetical protein